MASLPWYGESQVSLQLREWIRELYYLGLNYSFSTYYLSDHDKVPKLLSKVWVITEYPYWLVMRVKWVNMYNILRAMPFAY